LSGGKIKGSGSHTSLPCRRITSGYLVIQKGSRNVQHEFGTLACPAGGVVWVRERTSADR
jgi:hypothetical protein